MAGKITAMSKLKQALQLHVNGFSNRSIGSTLGLYKSTVNKYIKQFKELPVSVETLLSMDDPELERLFSSGRPAYADKRFDDLAGELPRLQKELESPHVTRQLLWEEYIRDYPGQNRPYGKVFCPTRSKYEKEIIIFVNLN